MYLLPSPSQIRIDACKFIINNAIGAPRQKMEMRHHGLSYFDLARSADEALKKAAIAEVETLTMFQDFPSKEAEEG